MDGQEFKVRGRQMVDYIIQYLEVQSQYYHTCTLRQSNRPEGIIKFYVDDS